jgi:predicted nucleotidyltransferase
MKTQAEVVSIVKYFAEQLKVALSDNLNSVFLFGSYARGDFEEYSDVDVMVLLNVEHEDIPKYNEIIRETASRLEWDYNILLPVVAESEELFYKYKDASAFFLNVINEGVRISD